MDQNNQSPVIVVSGLPRSGTSLMMNMLQAGGLSIVTDFIRTSDEDNPKGYFEFERAKALKDGDTAWLTDSSGKVVKVISALLQYLPGSYTYKVIFMLREIQEILDSQRQMIKRRGQPESPVNDEEMTRIYRSHLRSIHQWLDRQSNFEVLEISYNILLKNPEENLQKISDFLGTELDMKAMHSIIDPNLYRQRY